MDKVDKTRYYLDTLNILGKFSDDMFEEYYEKVANSGYDIKDILVLGSKHMEYLDDIITIVFMIVESCEDRTEEVLSELRQLLKSYNKYIDTETFNDLVMELSTAIGMSYSGIHESDTRKEIDGFKVKEGGIFGKYIVTLNYDKVMRILKSSRIITKVSTREKTKLTIDNKVHIIKFVDGLVKIDNKKCKVLGIKDDTIKLFNSEDIKTNEFDLVISERRW